MMTGQAWSVHSQSLGVDGVGAELGRQLGLDLQPLGRARRSCAG